MIPRGIRSLARSMRLGRVYLLLRERIESTQSEYSKILFRLQRYERRYPEGELSSFQFPWGVFDCLSPGFLRTQFQEIFMARQYGFHSDRAKPVIIDCGGNMGLSAIWFKLTYPASDLTVYEADPDLADILTRNVNRAGFNDVRVHRNAVWVADEVVAFEKTGGDRGRIVSEGPAVCSAIDLSKVLPPRVDLLKLDVEGAEFAILDRLCETGAIDRINCLISEFHVTRDMTADALRTLDKLRESQMTLAMTAEFVPWLGMANEEAPFDVIARKQVLMMVYAWRSAEGMP